MISPDCWVSNSQARALFTCTVTRSAGMSHAGHLQLGHLVAMGIKKVQGQPDVARKHITSLISALPRDARITPLPVTATQALTLDVACLTLELREHPPKGTQTMFYAQLLIAQHAISKSEPLPLVFTRPYSDDQRCRQVSPVQPSGKVHSRRHTPFIFLCPTNLSLIPPQGAVPPRRPGHAILPSPAYSGGGRPPFGVGPRGKELPAAGGSVPTFQCC